SAYAVALQHFHHAKDADPVAIVARRPVDDIGRLPSATGHRLVQRKGLDVRDDPEGEAGAIRPNELRPPVDRNVGEGARTLRLHGSIVTASAFSSQYVIPILRYTVHAVAGAAGPARACPCGCRAWLGRHGSARPVDAYLVPRPRRSPIGSFRPPPTLLGGPHTSRQCRRALGGRRRDCRARCARETAPAHGRRGR